MKRSTIEAIFAVAVIVGFFYTTAQFKSEFADQDLKAARGAQAGCERTNDGLRRPFYEFVSGAAHNRMELAGTSTGAEHDANVAAAVEYRQIAALVIQAVEDVAKAPGSPEVDCQLAFPLP